MPYGQKFTTRKFACIPPKAGRSREAARRKLRSKKTKIYICSAPWTKSELFSGKIRTPNFKIARARRNSSPTPLPSAAPSLGPANFLVGVLRSLPLPQPARARARHRSFLNIVYDNLEYNAMEYTM